MQEFTEHYHCSICGESYPTKDRSDECFWGHSELEILRWVAFELVSTHHFAEKVKLPFAQIPCALRVTSSRS